MSEYGKLNGVPIDPGEVWEIVPIDEPSQGDTWQMCVQPNEWHPFGNWWTRWTPRKCIEHAPNILAFRRPKQTVQAGQGESAPDLSGMIAIGRERQGIRTAGETNPASFGDESKLLRKYSAAAGDAVNGLISILKLAETRDAEMVKEIARLRTLTAAQAVALEKVEATIQQRDAEWVRVVTALETALNAAEAALNKSGQIEFQYLKQKALTLITAANEVGK